jgi:4-methoxybenzoate monooxygenase (O-demethylating)
MPTNDTDPWSHEVLEDPFPFQKQLREGGPVVLLTRYNLPALGRYEHVHRALVDWQSFESHAGAGFADLRNEEHWRPRSLLIEADPPRHDAPRRTVSDILGRRAIRGLSEQWKAEAAALVDSVLESGTRFDAVTELAEALPLRVFPDAVGITKDGREQLLPFGDHNFNKGGPSNDLVEKGVERAPQLLAWVSAQCERDALAPVGLGADIWAASDRGDIAPEMAPQLVRTLFLAGIDTTVHSLAALLFALATHPPEWERLRANPSLARVAFDEAVRWMSPAQMFFRVTTRDISFGDTVIPSGQKFVMFLGAANRDPRRWENPEEYTLTRDPSGHVGFGMGIHQCVGQHIARLEAEVLLQALIRRVSSIELAGATVYRHNNLLRGFESIPIAVELA